MKRSLYIYNPGTIKRQDNTLRFINENGEKRDMPIEAIGEIYIMTEMNFNTSLLNILSQKGIVVHYYNYYDYYIGSFYPKETLLSGELFVKQVNHYTDNQKRLELAQKFVDGAASNIYRNIRYYNSRGKDLQEYMTDIESIRRNIFNAKSVTELMGYEGSIRKIYYKTWNIIVNQDINFEKRVKNPPDNMINTLISFVNTLIYTRVLSEIYKTQLNPTISYLHEPGVRRFSLSLDISEIFKPLIGDRLIFSILNRNQITEKSFTENMNNLHLTKEASMIIAKEFDDRLNKTIKHKTLNKTVSYQYLMRLECYKIIKHLLGEKEYEPFKIWW